ncbi:hypothetical protein A4A49_26135 [Nicotiana attenuata]|uniref:Uncharacterized protein n=2 Tax=Nicotiana attenuata TaxID=49451 RepID=A0A314KW49_NICAT|nr:hypothetical protein A4A49_26135 [Nicotiana attenuata]
MAFLKLLFFSFLFLKIFLTISSNGVAADPEPIIVEESDVVITKVSDSDSSIRLQLDQLNSKISLLESRIDESTCELRRKDERIKELEKTIDFKLAKICFFAKIQTAITVIASRDFSEKGSLNANELVAKANVRAIELERQIDVLRRDIEAENKKKDTLETSTNVADEKMQELNLKLERVKEGWLPPWLAVHLVHFQSIVTTYWNEQGIPALDRTIEKALETKSEVVKLVVPHIHSFRTKWIPGMKERSVEFARDAGPHIQKLKTKTIDLSHTSKTFMELHIVKAQEVI